MSDHIYRPRDMIRGSGYGIGGIRMLLKEYRGIREAALERRQLWTREQTDTERRDDVNRWRNFGGPL